MLRRLLPAAAALALALALPAARGQSVVVPAGAPETGGLNTPLRNAPRTYMSYYTAANFGAITQPVSITGIRLRLAANTQPTIPASWPSQPLSFANFDVQMSRASAQLNADGEFLSSTGAFAGYQVAPVTTRSGPMTVAAGSYDNSAGAGGTNAFGPTIEFTTPYAYNPGEELLLYLTHTGYTPGGEAQPFFAVTDFQNGLTDAISSTLGYQASNSNGFSDPLIIEIVYAPVPEPAAAGLLAAAGLGVWRRSSRRRVG